MPRAADRADDASSPLADPGARLAAVLIDALLPLLPQIVLLPVGAAMGSASLVRAGGVLGWAAVIALFVVDVVLLARFGQTIGKRVMGLRIVRTSGARAGASRLVFVRTLLPALITVIPFVGWIFGLVDTLMIFTSERRTLHDRMADTIVIDLRAPLAEPAMVEVFR